MGTDNGGNWGNVNFLKMGDLHKKGDSEKIGGGSITSAYICNLSVVLIGLFLMHFELNMSTGTYLD